ncbi:MAG: hypothetical protein INR71_07410 [Terriglobus roseus]|nr:hypothetical protein [Terriglobus roseus]
MPQTRSQAQTPQRAANGFANGFANGSPEKKKKRKAENGDATASKRHREEKTDRGRWRLRDERGRHTWQYLEDDAEAAKWPQSAADKYYLNLDTVRSSVLQICGK